MSPPAGAIGSRFKIDASYLSPNVNMAARLEAATKQYHTSLLLSGPMYEKLTPAVRLVCVRVRSTLAVVDTEFCFYVVASRLELPRCCASCVAFMKLAAFMSSCPSADSVSLLVASMLS